MQFVLILNNGKIMTFFVKAVAETFQLAYGGTLIQDDIQETTQTMETV